MNLSLASAVPHKIERLVNLDDAATGAEQSRIVFAHRLADAMRQEPCGLVGDLQHPVELMRTMPFLLLVIR